MTGSTVDGTNSVGPFILSVRNEFPFFLLFLLAPYLDLRLPLASANAI
jgi:hypothetical protein